MSNCTMFTEILTSIISGLLLTLIFFFFKEKIFPLPNIDGSWVFKTKTLKSEYNPFKDMELTYLVLMWREGGSIYASAEKIAEDSTSFKGSFIGANRTQANIKGSIQKNIFSKDMLILHIDESGQKRQSSTIHKLKIVNNNKMEGHFLSTISNQEGTVVWDKKSS